MVSVIKLVRVVGSGEVEEGGKGGKCVKGGEGGWGW